MMLSLGLGLKSKIFGRGLGLATHGLAVQFGLGLAVPGLGQGTASVPRLDTPRGLVPCGLVNFTDPIPLTLILTLNLTLTLIYFKNHKLCAQHVLLLTVLA